MAEQCLGTHEVEAAEQTPCRHQRRYLRAQQCGERRKNLMYLPSLGIFKLTYLVVSVKNLGRLDIHRLPCR